MDQVKVVGLDPSLQSFGVAVATWVGDVTTPAVDTFTVKPRTTEFPRLEHLVEAVLQVAGDGDLVALEGPAYGSARMGGQGHHERAGLWWLLAYRLWELHVPVAVVPPNVRAKYATGRGNAGKDDVLLAVARRYPEISVRGNDEADALALLALACRHLDRPLESSLPGDHLTALDAVTWPTPEHLFPIPKKKAKA